MTVRSFQEIPLPNRKIPSENQEQLSVSEVPTLDTQLHWSLLSSEKSDEAFLDAIAWSGYGSLKASLENKPIPLTISPLPSNFSDGLNKSNPSSSSGSMTPASSSPTPSLACSSLSQATSSSKSVFAIPLPRAPSLPWNRPSSNPSQSKAIVPVLPEKTPATPSVLSQQLHFEPQTPTEAPVENTSVTESSSSNAHLVNSSVNRESSSSTETIAASSSENKAIPFSEVFKYLLEMAVAEERLATLYPSLSSINMFRIPPEWRITPSHLSNPSSHPLLTPPNSSYPSSPPVQPATLKLKRKKARLA